VPGFGYFAYWYLIGAFAFWFIGTETRRRTIDDINAEMAATQARGVQIVTAVCGVVAGCVSVGVQPFMPIPVFIGVGMTVVSPVLGGVILLASAISVIVVFGVSLSGVIGLLGIATVVLSAVAGVSSIISAFGPPAPQTLPAE
jgi:hypothetical protein